MAKFKTYTLVNVSLAECQYSIRICSNALTNSEFWHSIIPSKQVLIVSNQTVAPFYLDALKNALKEKQCDVVILPDGEEHKNQENLFSIYNELIQKKHHRDTTVLALGGGVIGDITGFAAATYQRGVGFIQIPTTLLAQVDASVGGKTAINHPLGKNLIGSFYQPQAVIIDVETLKTLPEREFRAGLGEVIKYAVLEGGAFYDEVQTLLERGLTKASPELPYLISQCCQIKARFVESDEQEHGIRALLNLGHTFAHALETYTHYKQWLHGEAVAIGLYCATILSFELGLIDSSVVECIEQMLKWAGLPHKIPKDVDLKELIQLMNLDKKIKNGCLRFVVIRKPGNCYLNDQITEHYVFKALVASVEGE
ncbi:3-dehydroquinate synthase [Legionella sp. km772]|uniref:3-dehydroquinate synthase n=1 Tax=Legionella sp. km772 TaxID=2498111 RepID=UPI000F8D7DCC|nr:3-dehydroquinate synthase [Legionella sp. km772]RUR12665.1 3-dehydroquinate synthase [Legionella sp. km772]